MAVTSSTVGGVNVWTFSGSVTDTQIQTAWSALITNGVYVINRAIYLDNTCDLTGVTGGFLVDFGTQVNPGIILHTLRDKTKTIFNNFTFLQRTGLSVGDRTKFVQSWNGTVLVALGGGSNDGLQQKGGGLVYGVVGNPGGGDPRYLNEIGLSSLENTTYFSQEYTEQELQPCVGTSTILKNLTFEKCFGFPQIQTLFGNSNVVVYRSTQNTQHATQLPIRVYPSSLRWASVCYVDSYVTRNNADVTTRLIDMFGSNANQPADVMILNNYTRESWFGASKTTLPVSNWAGGNQIIGGVLKKLQFINGNGGVVKSYDSRSTTVSQKTVFSETGFRDFLDTNLAPTTDANGKITMVHVGAICTTNSVVVTRYTGQKWTFQKFGYRVMVGTPDMTSGDNDLSAFSPISLTTQSGISRTQSAINSSTTITSFQDLLEELHVLAIGLNGSQSYNGAYSGNLFNFEAGVLTTNFTTVNVDATASSKISYNATTNALTIKSSALMDNATVTRWNNTSGVVSLSNGATIQGVYQDSTGTSTTLQITGFDANSAVYIEDNSAVQKYYSATATGTVTLYIPPTASGSWYYAVEKYGNQRQSDFFTFSGGLKTIVVKALTDTGITVTNQTTVGAYTSLGTPDKVYDYVAYLRLSTPHISYGQIVFKNGTSLDLQDASMLINQSFSSVASFNFSTKLLTIKSTSYAIGSTFEKTITTPPETIEADTTEVITCPIEDANGDSSLTIQGGSGNFTLWKITNATAEDDYATGTNLGTVGNVTFRFLQASGYKIVVRDNTTSFRQVVSMDKGIYTTGLFFGDQVQLAQSAEVTLINNKVDVIALDLNIVNTGVQKASKFIPHNTDL